MKRTYDRGYVLLICVVLVVATIIAFEPVRHNRFINFDDYEYVTENPQVKNGISRESIIWAFTTAHSSNWHPLTWLSHMLDCELFGLNPLWHHLSSLLFHIANTLLLFWVLKRMTKSVWLNAFVAAAFALHPLRVESVAWVAERKDVLSGFFWMLTIAAYIRYAERPGIRRYLLVVLSLCLGLMAKPMVVTLPFVLLLLDYWPLGRFGWRIQSRGEWGCIDCAKSSFKRLVAEKIPLFALVVASGVVTFIVQQSAGAMAGIEIIPLNLRISNALISYVRYIGKMIYPSHLAVLYPVPVGSLPAWQPIVCLVILLVISVGVVYMARRYCYLVVGWLWYLGTLVPVIGLIQVGSQAMADRYTYLPSIGIFIMVGWGAAELFARWRYRKIFLAITAVVVLTVMSICTRIQVIYWHNSLTLFGHTLSVTENNYVIHSNYGLALYEKGQLDEAVMHYKEALRIAPLYFMARLNIGVVLLDQERFDEAINHYTKVLRLKPDCVDTMNNLAWVLATAEEAKFRNSSEAVRLAERACELTRYEQPDLLDTLAVAYAAAGRFSQAIETSEKAIKLAEELGQKELTEEIQKHLQLFRSERPYIEKRSTQDGTNP